MNKRETTRRCSRARRDIVDVDPIGVDTARMIIQRHHGQVRLPREPIFAFVANLNTDAETFVVISERDDWLDIVGVSCHGDLRISDDRFDALNAVAAAEALACDVKPPFGITLAHRRGIFSHTYHGTERRRGAATRSVVQDACCYSTSFIKVSACNAQQFSQGLNAADPCRFD